MYMCKQDVWAFSRHAGMSGSACLLHFLSFQCYVKYSNALLVSLLCSGGTSIVMSVSL